MAEIKLEDVSFWYPVFDVTGRSLKVSVMRQFGGGESGVVEVQALSEVTLELKDGDPKKTPPIEFGRMEPTASDPEVQQQYGMVVGIPNAGQLRALGMLNVRGDHTVTCKGDRDRHPSKGPLPAGSPAVCEELRRMPDALERAMLRLLSTQRSGELHHRLLLAVLRCVTRLAASGIHLGDDRVLQDALARLAGMRGLVTDAVADAALEASYLIFERPAIERDAERTGNRRQDPVDRRASEWTVVGRGWHQAVVELVVAADSSRAKSRR